MLARIRQFFAPPVFEDDEEKTRIASLLNAILLALFLIVAGIGIYYLLALQGPELLQILLEIVVVGLAPVLPWFLMRRGHIREASLLFTSLFGIISVYLAFKSGGVRGYEYPSLVLVPVVAALLLGGRAAIVVAGLGMLAGLGLIYAESAGLLVTTLDPADYRTLDIWLARSVDLALVAMLLYLASGSLASALEKARRNERAHAEARRELQESQDSLMARSRDLEQRSAYLAASAEVGRAATSILDAEVLVQEVVDLIKEQFELYYVGLFFVDERREWAILQAGTGEAGRRMLAHGHRLRIGEGTISWCIANAKARVALDVGEDAVSFDNPDLPETRSEGALPLRSRGQVLGALTVQSSDEAAFDQDMLVVLQGMADQVAVALDNARLFAQRQEALDAAQRAYGERSREAWGEMLRGRPGLGYSCNDRGVTSVTGRADAQDDGDLPALATPVAVRGQVIGTISTQKSSGAGEWTPAEIALLESLADQLGVALDSARLYQDTQRREAQERLVGEVTRRMRETLDMDTVLRTAALELERRLGLCDVTIRLTAEDEGG